jgi:fluoride ion exporter CrcB/FEX
MRISRTGKQRRVATVVLVIVGVLGGITGFVALAVNMVRDYQMERFGNSTIDSSVVVALWIAYGALVVATIAAFVWYKLDEVSLPNWKFSRLHSIRRSVRHWRTTRRFR